MPSSANAAAKPAGPVAGRRSLRALDGGGARRTRTQGADAALRAVLVQEPDAFVVAIEPGPSGRFILAPENSPLAGRRSIQASTFLDVVAPPDRIVVIDTWARAREAGAARGSVHPAWSPEQPAALYFFDVTAEYGVFAGVLVAGGGPSATGDVSGMASIPPRLARVRKDELAVFTTIDAATTEILGWAPDQLIGRRSIDFVHPDDQERAIAAWMEMLGTPTGRRAVRLRHRRVNGSWVWMEVTNHNLLDTPPDRCVVTEMIDISDEMAALEALRAREQLLYTLAEALPIGVFQVTPDRRIVYANDRLGTIVGVEHASTIADQIACVAPRDRAPLDAALEAAVQQGMDHDVEVQVRLVDPARTRRCLMRIRALADGQGRSTGAIVCVEDVTESAELRAELEDRASHDPLTRVMNRRSIMALLEAALTAPGATGTAAIFVDLDGFKEINDRFGHGAGDEVLRIAADRLAAGLRAGDAIGRIGGDEFLIVCTGITSSSQARRIGRRVGQSLSRRVRLPEATIDVHASVGVGYARANAANGDELVRRADAAMYASKRMRCGAGDEGVRLGETPDPQDRGAAFGPPLAAPAGDLRRAETG